MMTPRLVLLLSSALLALAATAQAAEAMVLGCQPLRAKGEAQVEAYVDGFAEGAYPPKHIEAIRVLTRFGDDIYEFFPEQTKTLELRDGLLRIHLVQPLSAGESAEMRFEGKLAAQKGEPFTLEFVLRNERRSAQGSTRCTIE
jgi:hypothetical protein